MKRNLFCLNGNPIRIRTAKNMDGIQLQDLGYSHFKPGIRYDITHTKDCHIRLVKAYRYGDGDYDISFYTANLQPIADAGSILHMSDDPAIREFSIRSLYWMFGKAMQTIYGPDDLPSFFDPTPPPYYNEDDYLDFPIF